MPNSQHFHLPHPYLEKVTAFVTQQRADGLYLLLFQHPNAGTQIPAGTVEEDEKIEDACLREVAEETGLKLQPPAHQVGWRDELPPGCTHVIYYTTRVYSRPNLESFDWAVLRRGIAVRFERRQGDFYQITYEEGDTFPNPAYTSYQITGWVPSHTLAETNRRFFFHIRYTGEPTPDRWEQFTDCHRFWSFWAPVDDLPEITFPQNIWLDLLHKDLQ